MFTPGDGDRVLRFTNFETSSGPDVVVYLIAASNANDSDSVKNANPSRLAKGKQGRTNYEIPSDVDLNKYKSVTL
jgi:hypothetical protein